MNSHQNLSKPRRSPGISTHKTNSEREQRLEESTKYRLTRTFTVMAVRILCVSTLSCSFASTSSFVGPTTCDMGAAFTWLSPAGGTDTGDTEARGTEAVNENNPHKRASRGSPGTEQQSG